METSEEIWSRDNFVNKNILYLFNKEITEYDMQEAGFSIVKEFKQLDDETIKSLSHVDKERRKVQLGKIQAKNDEFKKAQSQGFAQCRKMFFEANDLSLEDVIIIKKDAIVTSKPCKYTKFGEYINFRPKHYYTSYISLGNRTKIYYSPEEIHIDGIRDSYIDLHDDYILKFIRFYCKKMESEEPKEVISFVRRFIDKYKKRELDVGYYRRFNVDSDYQTIYGSLFTDYWEDKKEDLDISYNYFNILIPFIKIPL